MSSCHECIATDGGCCSFIFADGWKIILLPTEVKRIVELIGKDPSGFIDTTPLTPAQREWYISRFGVEDPLWVRLVSLWTNPSGFKNSCPFIQAEGCRLSYQEKPFLCRIYPLDFNITDGHIFLPKETACPIGQNAGSTKEVLDYFGDDWEALQRSSKAFRQDFISLLNETAEKVDAELRHDCTF